jgi:hypothetical protein
MSVAYLDTQPADRNTWGRPPQPAVTKNIAKANRRRASALAAGHRLLGRKTLGNDERIIERMRQVADAYSRYLAAGQEILQLELL